MLRLLVKQIPSVCVKCRAMEGVTRMLIAKCDPMVPAWATTKNN